VITRIIIIIMIIIIIGIYSAKSVQSKKAFGSDWKALFNFAVRRNVTLRDSFL